MTPAAARSTRIKICGMTRVDDAMAAAQAGADAIGLIFWAGTPRVVTFDAARAIVAALPPFVTVVGLFVDPTAEEVRAALAAVPIDVLQFHGREPAAFCRAFGRRYVKAIAVADGIDLGEAAAAWDDAAGVLFDAHRPGDLPGGTGHSFDRDRLDANLRARLATRLIVSGGLDAGNVGAVVRDLAPWGVDVSSGVEERGADGAPRRGLKDPARVVEFVQAVRDADARLAADR